jgi:hypothetical protein
MRAMSETQHVASSADRRPPAASLGRPNLVALLAALTAAQGLHLLDELRTTDDGLFTILASPQAAAGISGAIAAELAVRAGHRVGPPLAIATAMLVGLGFLLAHGLPFASERTEPYWGDGSADALQWVSVGVIWILCAATIVGGRRVMRERRTGASDPELLSARPRPAR